MEKWKFDLDMKFFYVKRGSMTIFDSCWVLDTLTHQFRVIERFLPGTCLGSMKHIGLKKLHQKNVGPKGTIDENDDVLEELNYLEKLKILRYLNSKKDEISIEVFPRQEKLVDRLNMYHLWEFKKKEFPFDISKAFENQSDDCWEDVEVDGLEAQYVIRVANTNIGSKKMAYLYLRAKNGQELKWKQKQNLKNEIVGDELAVEVVCEEGNNPNQSCLICLPFGYSFDFGLA